MGTREADALHEEEPVARRDGVIEHVHAAEVDDDGGAEVGDHDQQGEDAVVDEARPHVDPVGLLVDCLNSSYMFCSWRKFLATVMPLIASCTLALTRASAAARAACSGGRRAGSPGRSATIDGHDGQCQQASRTIDDRTAR